MSGRTTTEAPAGVGRLHVTVAVLCGMVLFLEGYDIAAIAFAIPSMVDAWHVRPAAFTLAQTGGSIGLLAGALSFGLLGDRVGRKPVLIGAVSVFGLFTLLCAFTHTPEPARGAAFPHRARPRRRHPARHRAGLGLRARGSAGQTRDPDERRRLDRQHGRRPAGDAARHPLRLALDFRRRRRAAAGDGRDFGVAAARCPGVAAGAPAWQSGAARFGPMGSRRPRRCCGR